MTDLARERYEQAWLERERLRRVPPPSARIVCGKRVGQTTVCRLDHGHTGPCKGTRGL